MIGDVTLTPAAGRDYKSKKAVLADWEAGKDFVVNSVASRWNGKLCSIRDAEPGDSLTFRYKQLREAFVLDVK